ncbi:hypothetical protein AC249_AIPGENE4814 [Exaiptasia diaphana]|nr:hypothetical protein AC249_AIPGENE4814 [Exaiptasia diaphana]
MFLFSQLGYNVSEPTTSRATLSRSKSQSSVQKKTAGKQTINDTKTTKTNPKHHRRSCIAAPSTLTTETTSTLTNNPTDSTVKAVQKKKRRSCIEGLATGSVLAGAAQKSHKQKRRSCFAAPREMTQANSEVDDELKSLIARHNQRLAMLK